MSYSYAQFLASPHPPQFSTTHLLSQWPDCVLELQCPCSPRVAIFPVRLLLERGDRTFGAVLTALRCSSCRGKPRPVYLVAGHHRRFDHGPTPDWSLELVGPPRAGAD